MYEILKRSAVPVLLLLAGIASFVYGMTFHLMPVTQEVLETVEVKEQREVERPVPFTDPFQPPPGFPGGPPPGFPGAPPPFPPYPPLMEKVIETTFVTKNVTRNVTNTESEPAVVQGTTDGSVARLEYGDWRLWPRVTLTRTTRLIRSKDGKEFSEPPPGCPT